MRCKKAVCFFLWFVSAGAADTRPVSHRILIDSNVSVVMRDGGRLYAEVYRPVDPARFSVVVRPPYGKQREGIQ